MGTGSPQDAVDRDGDAANTGTGFGKPAKDLSINFVPVPYPDYQPAVIEMKPDEQQLWRVVNASGITYLNLELLFGPYTRSHWVLWPWTEFPSTTPACRRILWTGKLTSECPRARAWNSS